MERFFWCILICVVLFFPVSISTVSAQSEYKVIRQGKRMIEIGFHVKALKKFNAILENDSSVSEINLLAAYSYLELHEPHNALRLIDKIPEADDCVNYYKAWCYYKLEKFDEAKKLLQGVEEIMCFHRLRVDELKSLIENAADSYKYSKGFLVRNFGNTINSKDREYCAVMLNNFDSVLFTSRITDRNTALAEDGMGFEAIYTTGIDKDQNWSEPLEIILNSNMKRNHNATVQVIDEGKEVIIFHNGDLHFAKKVKNKWVRQAKINAISTGFNETHCYLTSDRNTIYFSSDYLSGDNTFDLFMATKNVEGSWSKPVPIEELNTPYDEDAPFISADGTFYFSSKGHNSIGGFDVFSTHYNEITKTWAPIKNLGNPINSVADDIYYNTFGKVGYISSSRLGGNGMLDLYQVLLFNKIKMQGKIITANNAPIPGAIIDVNYGNSFFRAYSDFEGNYEMYVPIDKNMQIAIRSDTIIMQKDNYIVKASLGRNNVNAYNFITNEGLSQDDEPVITRDFQNPSDTVTINLQVKNDLEKNELITGVLEANEKKWLDSLNDHYYKQHLADVLKFTKKEVKKVVPKDTLIAVLHFEFDSYKLTNSEKLILKKLAGLLSDTDYDLLEIYGYSDAVGENDYNQVLSTKRAQISGEYLIDHGISGEKLLIKGLGENNPIEDHKGKSSLNRRVEFNLKINIHSQ